MTITVFGLGFVGLTTSLGFAEYGHTVYGVEMNPERLSTIQNGQLPFLEPGLDEALKRHLGKRFPPIGLDPANPQDSLSVIRQSDCIYYCVGTPYGTDGQADLSYLFRHFLPDPTPNTIRCLSLSLPFHRQPPRRKSFPFSKQKESKSGKTSALLTTLSSCAKDTAGTTS